MQRSKAHQKRFERQNGARVDSGSWKVSVGPNGGGEEDEAVGTYASKGAPRRKQRGRSNGAQGMHAALSATDATTAVPCVLVVERV